MALLSRSALTCGMALSLVLPPAAHALTDMQRAWLAKAQRHEKHGWVYLHVEGPARERGFQHGYLLSQEIAEGVRVDRASWEYQTAMDWRWLLEKADALLTPHVDPENLAELDGLVEGTAGRPA